MPTGGTEWADVHAVVGLLGDFDRRWYVAGGWAIDCYLGRQTRPHDDLEIAIFRDAQWALHSYLGDWSFERVVDDNREAWNADSYLQLPVHELHASNPDSRRRPRDLEVLLNDREGGDWVYRRDPAVTRSLDAFGEFTATGIPYLAPEVVLLYKTPLFGQHDQRDFEACLPRLERDRRSWLRQAVRRVDPEHPWLERL
jgi:hypothetical protein